jgi:hypothetical protein
MLIFILYSYSPVFMRVAMGVRDTLTKSLLCRVNVYAISSVRLDYPASKGLCLLLELTSGNTLDWRRCGRISYTTMRVPRTP